MSDEPSQWATFREHADLDKRHTALEATVTHNLNRMTSDLTEIKMLVMPPQQPPVDHWQLTAQRAMDMLERRNNGLGHPVLTSLAMLGVAALAFAAGKFFF